MTAAAALFDGLSMDGIPDLITPWLDEGVGRTQKELAEACGVTPSTAGRWARGDTVPGGEDLARLAEVLRQPLEVLKSAAKESRRRKKVKDKREGKAPLRMIDPRYVLTVDDKRRWRELVQSDEELSDEARTVLRTFTTYFASEDALEVFVDKEQLAEEWSTLDIDTIESAWPEVVESRYVLRRNFPGSGWVFWLQIPGEPEPEE